MTPRIGRSIREGFRAANRSWLGMGFVAGVSVVMILIMVGGFLLTSPPPEMFQEAVTAEITTPEQPPSPVTEPAAQAPSEPQSPSEATDANMFTQLDTADEQVSPELATPVTGLTPDEQNRIIREWFGKAWPVLLLLVLFVAAVGLWLQGGEIGYLAKRVTTQQARVSEFWVVGTRAFWPLVGASLLGLVFAGAGVLVMALLAWVFQSLSTAVPDAVLVVLRLLFGLAIFIGAVWLGVRLPFWNVAIVVDRLGPLAGLRASFRATRGLWWRTFGLLILLVLIAIGMMLTFGLLDWLNRLVGGMAGSLLGGITSLLSAVANLYLGFVWSAALIRFYEDTRSAQPSAGPAGS